MDRGLQIGMPRQENTNGVGIGAPYGSQKLRAGHARHPLIRYNHIDRFPSEDLKSRAGRASSPNVVGLFPEDALEGFGDMGFIID